MSLSENVTALATRISTEIKSVRAAMILRSTLSAKGDLIAASGPNAPARLAVSPTDGHVLTVSSASPVGVAWSAPTGGSAPSNMVTTDTTQTISGAKTFSSASGVATSFGGLFSNAGRANANAVSRWVGALNSGTTPTAGTWNQGDFIINYATGRIYICTQAGTPGTWVDAGAASIPSNMLTTDTAQTISGVKTIHQTTNSNPGFDFVANNPSTNSSTPSTRLRFSPRTDAAGFVSSYNVDLYGDVDANGANRRLVTSHRFVATELYEGSNRVYSAGNPPPAQAAPSNMVTTDTTQDISGAKRFSVAPTVGSGGTSNALVVTTDTRLSDARTPTAHTHTSGQVTDFLEAVQDVIGNNIAAGANVTKSYDDETGVTTLSVVAPGEWVNTDPEVVRDVIGGALTGGSNISVTVNDAGDTITISATGLVLNTDARLSDARTPTAHTHPASQVSDSTTVGRNVLTATDAAAARSAIGAGTSSFSGAYSALSGIPTTFAPIIGSTATTAVAGNDPRLSDARTPTAHTHTAAQISDSTTVGRSVVTAADAAAARTAIGAGTSSFSGAYGDLSGRPTLGTLASVSPTGTASNATFLRGDSTWATPAFDGGTP